MRRSLHIIALWGLLLLAAVGCGKRQSVCTLKIDLQNVEEETIYLFGTHSPHDRLDTLHLIDGKLKHRIETDTLLPVTLLFNGTNLLPLFIDKELTVTISGDALLPDSIAISGGEENLDLQQFLHSVTVETDSLTTTTHGDVDSYVVNHPFSLVSIHLLNRYLAQQACPDASRLNTLIQSLSGMLQDDPLMELLLNKSDLALKSDTTRYIANFRIRTKGDVVRNANFYKGKAMVVSFWSIFDPQSLAMEDTLRKIRPNYKSDDVNFLSVCVDMDHSRWERQIEGDTLRVEHACEGDGWNGTFVKQFGVHALPTVMVLSTRQQVMLRSADIAAIRKELDAQVKVAKEDRRIKEAREKRIKEEQEARKKKNNPKKKS